MHSDVKGERALFFFFLVTSFLLLTLFQAGGFRKVKKQMDVLLSAGLGRWQF